MTPLWLSHHLEEDYDRCVVVRGRHVCRRCLVLYPLALATMVVVLAVGAEASATIAVAFVVLPIPAVVDFVVEHLGASRPSTRRLVAVTIPLGIGLGAGFARYARSPGDLLFWGVALAYALVCLVAALTGRRRGSAEPRIRP